MDSERFTRFGSRIRTRYVPVGATALPLWLIWLLAAMISTEAVIAASLLDPSSGKARTVLHYYENINDTADPLIHSCLLGELAALSERSGKPPCETLDDLLEAIGLMERAGSNGTTPTTRRPSVRPPTESLRL